MKFSLAESLRDLDLETKLTAEIKERLRRPWRDEEEAKAGKTPGQTYVELAERQAEEDQR